MADFADLSGLAVDVSPGFLEEDDFPLSLFFVGADEFLDVFA